MVAGYASPPASPSCGVQTNSGALKARCLAGLLLLGAVLLPAAPAAGQVTAPTAVTFTGHSSGFVTGAGQALTASVTPASPPDGHTVVYQWYRGVDASGSGGSVVSSSSNIYTTVNDDRGYRFSLGVRHRRTSDGAMSLETRATTFVGVRPERVPTNFFNVSRIGRDGIVTLNPTTLEVGERVGYNRTGSVTAPTGFGLTSLKLIQRRLGSSGDNWSNCPISQRTTTNCLLIQDDIGYSFRVCDQLVPIAPRVIGSELTCHLAAGGAPVPSDAVKIRLRVFLEGPLR